MPVVSVITPCYKAETYIERTIESVQAQTLADWEHIVVDDGSPDNSAAIVQKYAEADSRLQLIRQRNGGVCRARNVGAAASQNSQFLLFLDQDDLLEPEALQSMTAYMEMHPSVGAAYFTYRYIDESGNIIHHGAGDIPRLRRFVPKKIGIRELSQDEPDTPFVSLMSYFNAMPSGTIFRRAIFEKTRGWDEMFKGGNEDKDMLLQCVLLAPVHYVPMPMMRYRRHASNVSNDAMTGYKMGKQLNNKWYQGVGLTLEQRRMVRKALAFDNLLAMNLLLKGAREHGLRRRYRQSFSCLLQAFKKMGWFIIRGGQSLKA